MNKKELKQAIERLPIFEKRTLKVKTSTDPDSDEYVITKRGDAICKVGENVPYAFVGRGYALLQFKSIFLPVLEALGEVEGDICTYGGYSRMTIFPEMDEMKSPGAKFGLAVVNSVDMSSSVIVKFIVQSNNQRITVPTRVAGLKKQHTSSAVNVTQDYIKLMGKVKDIWARIITEFPKYNVVLVANPDKENELELKDLVEQMELGSRMDKYLHTKIEEVIKAGGSYNLWDFFKAVIEKVSDKKFTSEVHAAKKIDQISEKMFNYATVLGI